MEILDVLDILDRLEKLSLLFFVVFSSKELHELHFEVGCQYALSHGIVYLLQRPEAPAVGLLAGRDFLVVDNPVGIDEFVLAVGVELIHLHQFATFGIDAQFLASLAKKGGGDVLAEVDMTSNGSIPLAGLYLLPHGALLQVEFALAVEHMQVHYGMQEHGAIVALGACGLANDIAGRVNEGEEFLSPSRPTPNPSTGEGSGMFSMVCIILFVCHLF